MVARGVIVGVTMMMIRIDHACPVLDILTGPGTMVQEEIVVRQACSVVIMDSAPLLVVEVPSGVTAAAHLPAVEILTTTMVVVVMATVETAAAAVDTMVGRTTTNPRSSP